MHLFSQRHGPPRHAGTGTHGARTRVIVLHLRSARRHQSRIPPYTFVVTHVRQANPPPPSKQGVCIDVNRAVFCVCVGQGQNQSLSFRSAAVSSSAAHRVIPLMQSKHVINGPSQPALFVVRQTLKSNVSTMGGRGILLARQKC